MEGYPVALGLSSHGFCLTEQLKNGEELRVVEYFALSFGAIVGVG
jgi:hypothetical protein